MAYATQDDLVARFGEPELIQVSDRDGLGVVGAATVALALSDTEAEIDGYLAGRYALPLAATPAILTGIACDLARARLWVDAASERILSAAKNARALLRSIADGAITLGLPAASTPASTASPSVAQGDAVFGGGGLDDY